LPVSAMNRSPAASRPMPVGPLSMLPPNNVVVGT
jgi:hypothetical protein